MAATPLYDHEAIAGLRKEGRSWADIAAALYPGKSGRQVANAHNNWRARERDARLTPADTPAGEGRPETDPVILTEEQVSRITSLEDLLTFFKVDTERWEVTRYRVNKWEQHSVAKGVTPLYQVRAELGRNREWEARIAAQLYEQAVADMREHSAPVPDWDGRAAEGLLTGDTQLGVVALMDAHIGMLAWGREVGEDYDLGVAVRDYTRMAEQAIAALEQHGVHRILFLVGNDLLHVDHLDQGKVGVTSRGTPQDYDSRLAKIFTSARRATISAIDLARTVAPVDVYMVEGNHDKHSTYKLGEVIQAWYRQDSRVMVFNEPRPRHYYRYGKNLLGLTHGEEFKRKRDPLPLIMATEAPTEWAQTTHREWLTGHFHVLAEVEYMAPRTSTFEARGVRCRSLPGLTGIDAWHQQNGFKHQRAATALVYKRTGGLTALFEFHP